MKMTIDEYYKSLGWRLISDYGNRKDPFTGASSFHYGIDFGVPDRSQPYNNPVKIPWSGVVRAVRNYTTTRGLTVSIKVDGTKVLVLFQHLHSTNLKPGARVRAGDTIGIAGTTGRSTGIHLHFEVRIDDGSAIGAKVWGDPKRFNPTGGVVMKTIILSAGHGGSDSGAVGNGVREKDVNLAVTLATRDWLNTNYEGHRLVLPRSTDVFVSLPARRDLTREVNADLFVSQHHNWWRTPDANGFGTHLHDGPLYSETMGYRDIIHDTVYPYVATLGVRNRGKKRTNHWITGNIPAPTVLMEYMFLSNPKEALLASDPVVQRNLGRYTAEGIARALKLPKKTTIAPPPTPRPPTPQPPQEEIWYRAIAGSWRNRHYAEAAIERLKKEGYNAFLEVKR